MNCSKLSNSDECPIDIIFISMASAVAPLFHKLCITPNMVTAMSLLTGLAASYFLWYDQKCIAVLLFIISYFFDCLDGYMARKYNMETVFGDYFDHFSDVIKTIILLGVILYKLPKNCKLIYFGLFCILMLLTFMHLGCQEKKSAFNNSHSLNFTKNLCIDRYAHFLKYFGTGTVTLFLAISILNV